MASTGSERENWATRVGFILAAVGSAVGLGNIWRFPFQVGQEGGAAFLVMYLAFVLLIGLPAILVEFVIGRGTLSNTVGALREYGGGAWRYVGGMFVLIGFVILSYYSVVAGWVVRYFLGSFSGSYMGEPSDYFLSIASGWDALAFHALFMLLVIGIVAFGVQKGIELSVKIMVPALAALLVGLAIYAATLPGSTAAYSYYFSPDTAVIAENWQSILPAAAGQAFFTLSLGMGVMIVYSSYLAENRNLARDGIWIVAIDTSFAVLAGLVIFPVLFAIGETPGAGGAGELFISVAGAFAGLPFGRVFGALFFFAVGLAALSSAISLLEVVVAYVIDEHGLDRTKTAVGTGLAIFALGIPVTVDLVFVDLYDILAAQILLVFGGLLLMILVGWLRSDEALAELGKGIGDVGALGSAWLWLVRVPIIVVLLVSLWLAIQGYIEFLSTDFAGYLSG